MADKHYAAERYEVCPTQRLPFSVIHTILFFASYLLVKIAGILPSLSARRSHHSFPSGSVVLAIWTGGRRTRVSYATTPPGQPSRNSQPTRPGDLRTLTQGLGCVDGSEKVAMGCHIHPL